MPVQREYFCEKIVKNLIEDEVVFCKLILGQNTVSQSTNLPIHQSTFFVAQPHESDGPCTAPPPPSPFPRLSDAGVL